MNPSTRNLLEAALAGEALAALRYRLFAEQADEAGYDGPDPQGGDGDWTDVQRR
jgi:hypothetical protein